MIVSCPSCDSKYQVADDKVAGSMLRTRCKACGSSIVVDGTLPPPAGNPGASDLPKLRLEEQSTAASEALASSGSKPPPPQRTSVAARAPVNSKPPPPQRRSPTGAPTSPPERSGGSVSKKPVVDITGPDALDPNAPPSDFYSKLLSKVSSPKTPSQPAPSADLGFNPKKTLPPSREPFAPAADRLSSKPAPATHSGQAATAGGGAEAATGDFYAKILARVKPHASDPPPAHTAPPMQTSERTTLPPPTWGALPQADSAASPGTGSAASTGAAPIHVSHQAPAAPAPFNPKATAIGIGEFEIHVEMPGEVSAPEAAPRPEAHPAPDPAGAAHSAPLPAKHSEPPLAAQIQLPPIGSTPAEMRPPAGITLGAPAAESSRSTQGASAGTAVANGSAATRDTSTVPKPEPTLEPSVKSMTAAPPGAASFAPQAPAQPKRLAGMLITIVGVGLLGVGGGVAATIYALKPTLDAGRTPVSAVAAAAEPGSGPAAPPRQASAAQEPSAAPTPPPEQARAAASAESVEPSIEASEQKPAASKSATNAHGAIRAAAPAVAAPAKAPAEPPAGATNGKSADKNNSSKTGLPPAPTPAAPAKASGSGPFPKEVAQAMLGVAASQAPSCKKPGGPSGAGKAIVTFDTDGQVVITNIVGQGFSGTPTGQCVAALFRRVRVPPFAGDRATVAKVFQIPP